MRAQRITAPSEIESLQTDKRFQTGRQSPFRISTGLHKTFDQAPWQLILDHRRHQPSRQSPPRLTVWKYLPKITKPTGQCRARHTKKRLELLNRITPIPALAQRRDHQQHRRPINTAPPKQYRWRQHPAPAALLSTAQTQTDCVDLIKIRRTSPRLTQIWGVMQRPPTVGQRFERTFSARSTSIRCNRTKSDLRWKISGDIITPAFLWAGAPSSDRPRYARGSFLFPSLFLAKLDYFSTFFCGRTQLSWIHNGEMKTINLQTIVFFYAFLL